MTILFEVLPAIILGYRYFISKDNEKKKKRLVRLNMFERRALENVGSL